MTTYFEKYQKTEDGIEAIVTEGNHAYPYRVIFRDTDADETIAVHFGTLSTCHDKAVEFTK